MTTLLTFDSYQNLAESTAVFQHEYYPYASLMIEAAELADLVCKPLLRGDTALVDSHEVLKEAGDVLWNLAVICKRHNIKLSAVASYNLAKVISRQDRGVLMGSGGDR